MTLVAYMDGILAADSSGLAEHKHRTSGSRMCFYPVKVNKLFISSDKKIAVAYTGSEVDFTSTSFKSQLAILRRVLKPLKGGAEGIEKEFILCPEYADVSFFVMTKSVCFEVVKNEKGTVAGQLTAKLIPLSKDEPIFHGSGMHIAECLYASGISTNIDDIFSGAARYTYSMFPSEVKKVTHDDLRPFE